MADEPRPDIDRRLSAAFEPDAPAVARVVRAAAADPGTVRHRRRRRLRLAWASLAALAVAMGGAGAGYWRLHRGAEVAPPDALVFSGSFDGDVFVISTPDGSVSVSGPGAREDRPPDGSGIVFVEGDSE